MTLTYTRDELLMRREAILAMAKMTEEELFRRAEEYTLRANERGMYEAIRSIDFLLGR